MQMALLPSSLSIHVNIFYLFSDTTTIHNIYQTTPHPASTTSSPPPGRPHPPILPAQYHVAADVAVILRERRAPEADLDDPGAVEEVLFMGSPEGRPVGDARAEDLLLKVRMGVDVDQANRAIFVLVERKGQEAVARRGEGTRREEERGMGEGRGIARERGMGEGRGIGRERGMGDRGR